MLRCQALLLAIILVGSTLRVEGQERKAPAVVKATTESVVLLVVTDLNGNDRVIGSGFLVSEDGKVITNYHVIKDAGRAIAKMSNGSYFPVESILAFDKDSDLAVIRLPGRNLSFLKLGDSSKLETGQHVLAIGSPLGLQNTVSEGIISAVRQERAGLTWIQTTAPASPGNSGGPLVDDEGSVVGVITWGVRNGQNLNFAATSNAVTVLLGSVGDERSQRRLGLSRERPEVHALRDVKRIVVEPLGGTEAAALVKEKLINRLIASGKLDVVTDPDSADAILKGIVGADIYGRADTAAIQLITFDGKILWGSETGTGMFGKSASGSIADRLSKQLLEAISKETAKH